MRNPTCRFSLLALIFATTAHSQTSPGPFDTWREDRPGVERKVTLHDIPPPKRGTTREAPDLNNHPQISRLSPAVPKAPSGFKVTRFTSGLQQPRQIRVAPNGDIFVSESGAGRLLVFPAGSSDGTTPRVFASGLNRPFGIAFYPAGPTPQWVYIGENDKIVRFPYHLGDTAAAGSAEVIVPNVPGTHHWTHDVVVAADGQSLFYSVGSGSNEAGDMPQSPPGGMAAFIASHPLGEAWGPEQGRAEVRRFDPEGHHIEAFATGLRNCVSMAVQPDSGALWCVVNERDALGDYTPPDYATSVKSGGFYGWPWTYIGDHPDPRIEARPDLLGKATVPDVLLQAHTAPLGIVFYQGQQFPADYRGDAFVTMHGSWDRTLRAGYKVVRLRMSGGKPTGIAQDFLTGFVIDDHSVWGRPVGVAVTREGSLLVSDDGSGSIWRVSWAASSHP